MKSSILILYIDRNKSIKHQVTTVLDSHQINLQNSRRGGYESVVIDGDKPFISLENNGYGHDDLQTIRQHNEEYMHNQNKEEEKMDTSKSYVLRFLMYDSKRT